MRLPTTIRNAVTRMTALLQANRPGLFAPAGPPLTDHGRIGGSYKPDDGPLRPKTRVTRNRITKIISNTFAIHAASPAMPPKPNTAAMMAPTRKIKAQRSIAVLPSRRDRRPARSVVAGGRGGRPVLVLVRSF